MAMSYIIFINPTILAKTGMDFGAVFTATILASIIGTLIMGLFANVPYAQSAGMGLNAMFTYTICQSLGFTWQQGLGMVFICGLINLIITITNIRQKIIGAIPKFLQYSISVGIGLFIAYIGIKNANLLQYSVNNTENGIVMSDSIIPALSNFNTPAIILTIIGLLITTILVVRKVKGAYLIGIIATTLIGIPMGITTIPDFSNYSLFPSIESTFMQLDILGLFTVKSSIVVVIMTIFTLSISDIFDTIGTFVGTARKVKIFKMDKDGKLSKELERAMFADSIATSIGAMLGTSNVTTYIESSAGIEAGGRTGLTAVFVSLFFAVALFASPIVLIVPSCAVAPVLILVGASMISSVINIDWKDITIAIPAFFTIIFMPFAYSITTGIEIGFIFYTIINITRGKYKEVSPIIYVFSLLFITDFIYKAL